MLQHRARWTDEQRQAFWQAVRGRLAELNKDQEQVARELGLHRSSLSRRLSGDVRDPPDAHMLEVLLQSLHLEGDRAAALVALAAGPDQREPAVPAESGPRASAPPLEAGRDTGTAGDLANRAPARRAMVPRPLARGRWLAAALIAALIVGGLVAVGVGGPGPVVKATITEPQDGAAVPLGWANATGAASNVPSAGPERLWLVEELAGYYWPQQQAVVQDGTWVAQLRLGAGAADAGKRLNVLLVLTSGAADRELRSWLERGAASGDYPPMRGLPDGARILDRVAVTILPN